jgi:hypothetical protein
MKNPAGQRPPDRIGGIAESYVKLALAVGEHDGDYVDAYFGPPEWREQVKANPPPLEAIRADAQALLDGLRTIDISSHEEIDKLRHQYLVRQLGSLSARVEMLSGKSFSFDDEALALYDVQPPHHPEAFFQDVLHRLDGLVPGTGSVAHRYDEYRSAFVVPVLKLDVVFEAAIRECRERTVKNIPLPSGEHFTLEYATNKPWSGYNWYKGDSLSLIQINIDLPIYIDRAIDLAAHEGYPGHHVYNSLLEAHLAQKRGWVEFTIYALFSPQSLIAEGTANFGIEVAFPGKQRVEFERSVLFPLAGLDGSGAEQYYAIHNLTGALNYAHNEAARGYLDGKMTRNQAEEWLVRYALMSPERAKQRVRFIDAYRSYVINYNLGQDLVRKHIEMRGGTADNPEKRWEEFRILISSPRLPSGL